MRGAALGLLLAAFALTFAPGPWGDESISDLYVYRQYAAVFLDGALPYRDVGFEYPPLAAAILALPGIVGTGEDVYRLAFAALTLSLAAGVVVLVGTLALHGGGDRRVALIAAGLTPLATGAMIRTHFDLVPVALTLAALALLCGSRPRTGFAVLGLAVMTKGYPLVAVPVALAWLVGRGRPRDALAGAGVLAATLALIAAVSLLLSPSGALDAVEYHGERPLQAESTAAVVAYALDAVGAGEAHAVSSHRSDGIFHPVDGLLTAAFAVLLVAAVAICAAACLVRTGPRELVLAALATTVAFAALGKVLSPQFLIWVAPLAALALAWRLYALASAAAAAVVLTLVEFPAHYADVVAREPLAVWLVAARNALLLLTLALCLRELGVSRARARAAARWRSPFRSRPPRPAPR